MCLGLYAPANPLRLIAVQPPPNYSLASIIPEGPGRNRTDDFVGRRDSFGERTTILRGHWMCSGTCLYEPLRSVSPTKSIALLFSGFFVSASWFDRLPHFNSLRGSRRSFLRIYVVQTAKTQRKIPGTLQAGLRHAHHYLFFPSILYDGLAFCPHSFDP